MEKRTKSATIIRALSIASVFALVLAAGSMVLAQTPSAVAQPLTVSVSDLTTAGFHGVTVQPPQGAAFQPPNYYFHTQETVAASHPEWGSAANLVAVLIMPISTDWKYNGGVSETRDYSGRTQVRLSRPGYYIVVTGPDKEKVTALATALKNK